MARAKKAFPKGTLVRYTAKFLRSIGSVTGSPVDGIVLGAGRMGNLVAWSDGYSAIVNPANLQKAKRQLSPGETRALLLAERERLFDTMTKTTDYTRAEVAQIAREYNGGGGSKEGKALEAALRKAGA